MFTMTMLNSNHGSTGPQYDFNFIKILFPSNQTYFIAVITIHLVSKKY